MNDENVRTEFIGFNDKNEYVLHTILSRDTAVKSMLSKQAMVLNDLQNRLTKTIETIPVLEEQVQNAKDEYDKMKADFSEEEVALVEKTVADQQAIIDAQMNPAPAPTQVELEKAEKAAE